MKFGDEGEDASLTTLSSLDADFHDEQRVLEALTSVPLEMVASLADKPTVKRTRDSIAATRISIDRVHKVTLQKLRQD